MKIISWNIDSINAALTSDSNRAKMSREVLATILKEDPDIIAIQETKLPKNRPKKKHKEIMADMTTALKNLVAQALKNIAEEKGVDFAEIGEIHFERPKQENHGDWATNAAMQNCKALGCKPRDLAQLIAERLGADRHIRRIEVAGPGFINFYMSNLWMADVVRDVLTRRENYGRVDQGNGRKAQIEFVSANPTGPLHIGHGRGAAVGDVTGNILAFAGWNVEKEYPWLRRITGNNNRSGKRL